MIGTSYEMLLYLSYIGDIKEQLKLTPSRLVLLRHRLSSRSVTEEELTQTLTKLGCRCLRPRVFLPCIVKDKNGRLYDEYTFVSIFFTPELAEKYHADYMATLRLAGRGISINRALFKHILKKRRAWIVIDSMVIDSVWSYEPIEITMTKEKVTQVQGMLARSLPYDESELLVYKRKAPKTKPQDEDANCTPSPLHDTDTSDDGAE